MAKAKINFKEAYDRLEKIVAALEGGDSDLDEAVKKYEEGLLLVQALKVKLQNVETKVTELRNKVHHDEA